MIKIESNSYVVQSLGMPAIVEFTRLRRNKLLRVVRFNMKNVSKDGINVSTQKT